MLIRVWAPAATGERGLSPAVVPWSDRVPPSVPRRGSRSPRCAHPLPGPQSRGAGGRKRGKARAKPTNHRSGSTPAPPPGLTRAPFGYHVYAKRGKARAKPTIDMGVRPRCPHRLFRSAIVLMLRGVTGTPIRSPVRRAGAQELASAEKLALAQPSIWEHARVFP